MNFQQFLDEQLLQEAPSTSHGKVESALRSLNLEYKNDRSDTGRAFYLDKGYIVISYNNGKVELLKKDDKKPIASIQELDDSKLIKSVTTMLEKNAPELFGKEKEVQKTKVTA